MSSKRKQRCKIGVNDDIVAKIPRTRSQVTEITALNDDCLLEVFRDFSLVDLCAVKGAHQRFAWSANHVFKRKFLHSINEYFFSIPARYAPAVKYFADVVTQLILCPENSEHEEKTDKLFALLKYGSALESLAIASCNLDCIPNNLFENIRFENLKILHIDTSSGSESKLKIILNACNPLTLGYFIFRPNSTIQISDDSLAFIADRMVNLKWLTIKLSKCTSLFRANLSKLQNLRKLAFVQVYCSEIVLIAPLINELAKIDSLENLTISNESDIILNEKILIEAIENLSNVRHLVYLSDQKIPALEQLKNFKQITVDSWKELHSYSFTR